MCSLDFFCRKGKTRKQNSRNRKREKTKGKETK